MAFFNDVLAKPLNRAKEQYDFFLNYFPVPEFYPKGIFNHRFIILNMNIE